MVQGQGYMVILNNPFFIISDNSFKKRIEFIAFKMQITSVDVLIWRKCSFLHTILKLMPN